MQRNCGQPTTTEQADEVSNLAWPPTDAATMRAWQNAIGSDAAIACHLGLSTATVGNHRRRHGVAPLREVTDRRMHEKRPRARMSGAKRMRIYSNRRYEDVRLRERPANAVPGIGWVL